MGKVKSIVITTFVCLCTLALVLLSALSFPFSNGVKNFDGLLGSVKLGSEFTGQASITIYPEGVISSTDYYFGMPEGDGEADYKAKYTQVGGLFVEADKATDELKNNVAADAKVLNERFGMKGYSAYSVTVEDEYSIKITVPTDYTYAQYRNAENELEVGIPSTVSSTMKILTMNGGLTLRNSEVGYAIDADNYNGTLSLASKTDKLSDYFQSISMYSNSKRYAVRCNLTKDGREKIAEYSTKAAGASDDNKKAILFYVGEEQLISLSCTEKIDENYFFISVSSQGTSQEQNKSVAEDYCIILSTVIDGKTLALDYNVDTDAITTSGVAGGTLTSILTLVTLAVLLIVVTVLMYVKYKKLGLVVGLTSLIYALVIIVAAAVTGLEITFVSLFVALLGYGMFMGSNIYTFDAIRRHTQTGKTMPSSVKEGYKTAFGGVLDLHVVLVVISIVAALVGIGLVSTCGIILLIATLASFILYWFTRLMWYVTSAPAKDKFAFAGYKREVYEDD